MQNRAMWSPSWQVRKMRSPQTAGVDSPMPGSVNFQARLSLSLQCVGRSFSLLIPSSAGPRHWGQFSADAAPAAASTRVEDRSKRTAERSFMAGGL